MRFGWEIPLPEKPFCSINIYISCIPFQNVLSWYETYGSQRPRPNKKRVEIYTQFTDLEDENFVTLSRPSSALYHCLLQCKYLFYAFQSQYFWIDFERPRIRNCCHTVRWTVLVPLGVDSVHGNGSPKMKSTQRSTQIFRFQFWAPPRISQLTVHA